MGNKKSRAEITEDQKRRAIHLKNQGWLNRDVARDTGILEGTIANCWKRWAQELGVQIITREESCEKAESMPVTVSYVEPLPPLVKKAAPVRPETPSVLESVIQQMRAEEALKAAETEKAAAAEESSVSAGPPVSAGTPAAAEAVEAEVIEPDPLGAFRVMAVEVQAPRELPEDEAETAPKKKAAASGRRMKRADKLNPPAGRKAPEPKKTTELQKIYGLIGLINEAVVDYAIEMMVLPEQIGQSIEVSDGTMTMVLTVPVGGVTDV